MCVINMSNWKKNMNFIFYVSLSVYIYTANVLEEAKKKSCKYISRNVIIKTNPEKKSIYLVLLKIKIVITYQLSVW